MEVIPENDNSNINMSNIINNQNESNQKTTESSNQKDYPFQLITKEEDKSEINYINNKDKNESDDTKNKFILRLDDNTKSTIKNKEIKDNIRADDNKKSTVKSKEIKDNIRVDEVKKTNIKPNDNIKLNEERKITTKKNTIINSIISPRQDQNQKKPKNKNHRNNLDNLSPEVYMRKKMDYTEPNINPLEIKIKRMEEILQKQTDYDYKMTMEQIKSRLDSIKKIKKQQKHIQEEEQKLKEKLQSMEEYREKIIKEKAKKVLKKQNRSNKLIKQNKTVNKSKYETDSNNSNYNSYNNSIGRYQTLDTNNPDKLPIINSVKDKYKLIKEKKDMNEKEFIHITEENLRNLEMEHNENLLCQNNILSGRIRDHSKKYNKRNEQYSKFRIEKELEKNEKILQKDIARSYNIKLNILRDRSEKSGRLKEKIKKNLENFNEKKEILEQKEKKKIKEYLKKMNKYNNSSKNFISNKIKRQYYSNLQKANINSAEKEIERKYNDYLMKQQDLLNIVYDIQQEDDYKRKNIYQSVLLKQNENEEKYQSFSQFLENIEKNNIMNKPDSFKLKLYNKKVKEELEEKRRKEEEELNK